MIHTLSRCHVLEDPSARLLLLRQSDHLLAFTRAGLIFVFNFDPVRTHADVLIEAGMGCDHAVLFTTDDACYGGFANISHAPASAFVPNHPGPALRLCLPPRTAMVLMPQDLMEALPHPEDETENETETGVNHGTETDTPGCGKDRSGN